MQEELFKLPEVPLYSAKHCRDCVHCQRWEYGGKFFFYCGKIPSNRTENGLLKIKCKNLACNYFKETYE